MNRVFLESGTVLDLEPRMIGSGGSGTIHAVAGEPQLAVKRYDDGAPRPHLERHLRTPAQRWLDERGVPKLAWPAARVLDEQGATVGFVMLRLGPDWRIADWILSAVDREQAGWPLDWADLLEVATALARLVAEVHEERLVIADLSASNVMTDGAGSVALVDCDDMLWLRETRAEILTSPKYTAPEILRADASKVSQHSDNWSLAVLICQLLLDGSHPFEGAAAGNGAEATLDDNVLAGATRFKRRRFRRRAQDDGAVGLDVLGPDLLVLGERCFVEGHDVATGRPRAREWAHALAHVEVRRCAAVARHAYVAQLGDRCPWCAYRRDPFAVAEAVR
jgi:DNA-binding helix-hairpin-helix protein with protein kinase domain